MLLPEFFESFLSILGLESRSILCYLSLYAPPFSLCPPLRYNKSFHYNILASFAVWAFSAVMAGHWNLLIASSIRNARLCWRYTFALSFSLNILWPWWIYVSRLRFLQFGRCLFCLKFLFVYHQPNYLILFYSMSLDFLI